MKQLLQNIRSGETVVTDVPIPTPKDGSALVRIAASLVSAGTERMIVEFAEKSLVGKARSRPDLVSQVVDKARREGIITTVEAALNRLDQPIPLGYSSAGTIIEIGAGMKGYRVGERVACAGGGYAVHAEYNLVPQNLLALLPDNVDFESAAFTTLGAIALHGFRLAETQIGETIAVIGLGLLGLLTVGIAKAAGCRVLGIDIDPSRIEFAHKFDIEATLREGAEEVAQSFSRGRGFDGVLICADTPSNDPVELAGSIARDRAHVVATGAVGLNFPRKLYFEKELSFINSRSYGPGRYDPTYEEEGLDYPIGYVRWTEGRNLESFIDLISNGRLNVNQLITHRFSIEQAPNAYDLITGKTKESFTGVLITYPEAAASDQLLEERKRISNLSPTLPSSTVSLGVLGAGNFASAILLPSVTKIHGLERVGIASASGLNSQLAADRFNFHYATSDEQTIINDPDINTIAILTRHHLHARQVISTLEVGKHVFCEKPLALTPTELAAIQTALAAATPNCLLMVGFNRRFAPFAIQLKEFFNTRTEPLMAHYRVNAGYLPQIHWLHDPKVGGGRIIGEGCHFIDFLVYLVGAPPLSVSTQALPDDGRYREDNVLITYQFPDGSIGTVSYLANGDKAFPKERVEVFCGGRIAVLDDFRTLQTIQNGHHKKKHSRLRQDKGHQAEWEAFADAIKNGDAPPIPYDQIFGTMNATIAAVQSLHSGKKLPITT